MAKEIQASYWTGCALYALLLNTSGQIYNGSSFEVIVDANWDTYDLPMTEEGTSSGIYTCNMPGVVAGLYNIIIRRQDGASPAVSDPCIGVAQIHWDGLVEVPVGASLQNATYGLAALKALLDAIDTSTESAARFTEIKGAEWTAETLKAICDAIATLEVDEAAIADAVWDEATTGHVTAGTFGAQLKTQVDALVNRLGAFLGTGVDTVKGYLEAIASKAATLPSGIGDTFTPTTDSTEAIRDKLNALGATVTVQPSSVIRDGEWEFYTHDVVVQPVTGLGDISGYKDVWVTLKKKRKDPDGKAVLLFSTSVGLEVLNGSSAATAGDASVAVDSPSDGDITMKLKTGVSERLGPWEDLVWGIKWKDTNNEVYTLLDSLSTIKAGPVKATS